MAESLVDLKPYNIRVYEFGKLYSGGLLRPVTRESSLSGAPVEIALKRQ